MAAMMRDWLGGKIDRELRLAIEWSKRSTNAGRRIKTEPDDDASATRPAESDRGRLSVDPSQRLYEDDGSNLRVKLEHTIKEGWVLQLVRFLTFDTPIQAVLSDGYTLINATFSSAAVAAFETNRSGRQFTNGTRGGIFNTERFEIVATPYGPSDQQVSLLITAFNWLSSDGSPSFGHPKPVETRSAVSKLLHELLELRNGPQLQTRASQDNHDLTETPTSPQPVASPPFETCDNNEDASLMSQAPLNTQIALPTTKRPSPEVEVMGGVNLARPTEAKLFHHANSTNYHPPYSQNTMQKQALLLSLLPGRHDPVIFPPPQSIVTGTSHNPVVKGTHAQAVDDCHQPRDAAATMDQNSDRDAQRHDTDTHGTTHNTEQAYAVDSDEPLTTYEAEADSRGKEGQTFTDVAAGRSPRGISNPPETPEKSLRNADALRRPSPSTLDQSLSRGEETHTRTEDGSLSMAAQSAEGLQLRTPQPASSSNEVLTRKGSAQQQKVAEAVANTWQNLPRITRAICRVPDSQQTILNKRSSWLPSKPGDRFPPANIPPGILEQLNQMAQPRQIPGSPVDLAQDRESNYDENGLLNAHIDVNQNQPPDAGETDADSGSVSKPSLIEDIEQTDSSAPLTWSGTPSPFPSPSAPPKFNSDLPPDSSLPAPSSPTKPRIDTSAEGFPHSQASPLHANPQAVNRLSPVTTPQRTTEKPSQRPSSQLSSSVQSHGKHTRTPTSARSDHTSSRNHANYLGNYEAHQPAQEDARPGLLRKNNQAAGLSPSSGLSDEESELELSMPHALVEHSSAAHRQINHPSGPIHRSSTTASVEHSPKLQVEETPYNALKNGANTKIRVQRPLSRSLQDNISSSASHQYLGPTPVVTSSSSSAPLVPSTFDGVKRSPLRNRRHELAMDGTSEGDRPSSEVREMVDQQMRNELAASQRSAATAMAQVSPSRSSKLQSPAQGTPESCSDGDSPSPKSLPSPHAAASPPHKRKTTTDRQSSFDGSKKRKLHSLHFGFSQESPVSQDPATRAQRIRDDYFNELERSRGTESSIPPDRDVVHPSVSREDQPKVHKEAITPASETSRRSGLTSLPGTSPSSFSPAPNPLPHSPVQRSTHDGARWVSKLQSTPSAGQGVVTPDVDSVFKTFTTAYPNYRGDTRHFYGLCRMIDRLQKAETMQHRSLWDDFIIRHKTDYQLHILRCSDEGDDPITYERFYRDEIEEPKYTKRIMNPSLLKQALMEVTDSAPTAGNMTSRSASPLRRESYTLPPAPIPVDSAASVNYQTGQKRASQAPHRREPSPKRPYHTYRPTGDSYRPNYSDQEPRHRKEVQRPSHARAVSPELGDESLNCVPTAATKGFSTVKPTRNSSGLVAPPPTQSSATEPTTVVPRPHPAIVHPHTSSSRPTIPAPRAPIPASTSNPFRSRPNTTPGTPVSTASQKPSSTRRSFPWSTNPSTSKPPSPLLTAASTNTSIAQKTRTPSPRVQTSATATAIGTERRSRKGGRGIEGSEAAVKGSSRLRQQADGARANAQAGSVVASSDPPSDLIDRADKRDEGGENKHWYRDMDTPFKEFARTWAGLKNVEGRLGAVDERGILRLPVRNIDVLRWRL